METAVADCTHCWIVKSPQPGMVEFPARCKFCGEERTFPAEAPTWRDARAERLERLEEPE